MGIINDIKVIDSRYNGAITLLDAINDPIIYNNLEKFYVPETVIQDSIFIKKDANIAITENGHKKIRFIYLNQHGKNMTNPDMSFIQIHKSCKGFLVRLSITGSNTAENLELDYIVDISNIKYIVDSIMSTQNINSVNSIVMNDIIHFSNIDFNDYYKVNFDENIRNFALHKQDIFDTYF